jgi:CRISPR-associated protein Csx3
MALVFPAIFIGGPPHSGKSTLTYRLRQALLARGVAHYVLRASPDGEGNWSSEAPRSLIAALRERAKGSWSESLGALISRDIASRHLPLLVDAGGKISDENAMIAAQCTHAILIAADPADLVPWRDLVATHGLALIADLHSSLDTAQSLVEALPTVRGVIGGLAPGQSSDGAVFDALCGQVAQLFAYAPDELFRAHLALTDLDLVLHVEQAIYPLAAHAPNSWRPDELPRLLGSLPPATSLGVYGIGPGWLYAALAAFSYPARFVLFDPRLGWIEPPAVTPSRAADKTRLRWDLEQGPANEIRLRLDIVGSYLRYDDAAGLPIPQLSPDRGVIIDGRLPHWLTAALVRAYRAAPWIALYYPPLHQSIVISSHDPALPIGSLRTASAES